jgi:hypothetical protein
MWKGGLLTLGMSSVLSLGLADKYEYEYQSIFVFIFWSKFNHIHVPRLAVLEYEYIHKRSGFFRVAPRVKFSARSSLSSRYL